MSARWRSGFNAPKIFEGINATRIQKDGKVSYRGFNLNTGVEVIFTHLEHSYKLSPREIRGAITSALVSKTNGGRISHQQFLVNFERFASTVKRKSVEQFHILTSLSYRGKSPFKNISLDGCKIVFNPKNIKKYYKNNEGGREFHARQITRVARPSSTPYPFLLIVVHASSPQEAYEIGLRAAEKFRGLLNYFHGRGRTRWASVQKPANDFRWGLIHSIHRPNGENAWDGCMYEHDFFPSDILPDISNKNEQFRKFFLRVIRINKSSPLHDAFWEGLIRYNNALDRSDWLQSFRELWSVLEFVTHTGKNGYEVTVRRASSVYKNHEYHYQILNHLRLRRNAATHLGMKEDSAEDLMFSCKNYIEDVLRYLMGNGLKFASHAEFGEFLDMPPEADQLREMKKQLRRAIRFRTERNH